MQIISNTFKHFMLLFFQNDNHITRFCAIFLMRATYKREFMARFHSSADTHINGSILSQGTLSFAILAFLMTLSPTTFTFRPIPLVLLSTRTSLFISLSCAVTCPTLSPGAAPVASTTYKHYRVRHFLHASQIHLLECHKQLTDDTSTFSILFGRFWHIRMIRPLFISSKIGTAVSTRG